MPEIIETTEKVSAENSFLMTFIENTTSPPLVYNFVMPLMDFEIEESHTSINIIYHQDLSKMESKFEGKKGPYNLIVDFTNDPTPQYAGSIVSLGYPLIRMETKECKIISYNPLTINANPKNHNFLINREQRESLCEMPNYKLKNPEFILTDESIIKKYYKMSTGVEKPIYIINCVVGKHNYSAVDILDLTTFYQNPFVFYYKKHPSPERTIANYQRLIKKYTLEVKKK